MIDTRESLRFCPHPAKWLNQRRWEDGIPDATPELIRDETESQTPRGGHAEARAFLERTHDAETRALHKKIAPLHDEINDHAWDAWISPLLFAGKTGNTVVLFHESPDWVREYYGAKIGRVLNRDVQITDDISDFM